MNQIAWASIPGYSGRITLWSSQIMLPISSYKKWFTFTFCFKKTIIPILSHFLSISQKSWYEMVDIATSISWMFGLERADFLSNIIHLLFVILPWPTQVTAADVTCQNPKLQNKLQPDTLIFGQDFYIHFHDNEQFLSKAISWFE